MFASKNGENGIKSTKDQKGLCATHPKLLRCAGALRNQFLDTFGHGVVTVDNQIDEPFGAKLWRDSFVNLGADAVKDATLYIHGQRVDRNHYETIYRFPPEKVLEFGESCNRSHAGDVSAGVEYPSFSSS